MTLPMQFCIQKALPPFLLLILQSPAHQQEEPKLPPSSSLKPQLFKGAPRLWAAQMSDTAGVAVSATEPGDRIALLLAHAGKPI